MIAAPIVSIVKVRSGVRIIGGSMTSIIVEPENSNKIKIVKFTSLLAKPTKSCTCLGSLASQQQRMVLFRARKIFKGSKRYFSSSIRQT